MLGLNELTWDDALRADLIKPGMQLAKAEHLFKPITDEEIAVEVERLHATSEANIATATTDSKATVPTPMEKEHVTKSNITFEEFTKLDLRAGTIVAAEKIPKADKLLKLSIDLGEPTPRTIVSGIAEHFEPEAIVGSQVLVLCNLDPRKMRGVESQGMVLMGEDAEGKLVFVQPKSPVPNGSEVR